MTDLPGRIRIAAERVGGLNQLSELTGIPRRSLGNWLQGRKPKPDALKTIAEVSGVDLHWLVSGEAGQFDVVLGRMLKQAGGADRDTGPNADFDSVFHRALDRVNPSAAGASLDVDEALMETLAKVATSVYDEARQRLPVEKITVEATRLLNRLRQIADPDDAAEVALAIPLLRYQLQKRLAEAAKSPGTGKRSAS